MNIISKIVTTIEGDFDKAVTVVEIAWDAVDGKLQAEARIAASDALSLVEKLSAAEWVTLKGLAQAAFKDVLSGDWADIETHILNAAEASGAAFVSNLGSAFVQAFAALMKSL